MFRHRNTAACGKPFPAAVVQAVWGKAASTPGHGPLKVDAFGSLIWEQAFGNTNSKLGWEIHHRIPVEEGGTDDLDNLEAIQWENHRRMDSERPGHAESELGDKIIEAPQPQELVEPSPHSPVTEQIKATANTPPNRTSSDLLRAAAML